MKKLIPKHQTGGIAEQKYFKIKKEIDSKELDDQAFKDKYKSSKHEYKYNNDLVYRNMLDSSNEQRRQSGTLATLNIPSTDIRSKLYQGNPNLKFLPGNNVGESRAAQEDLFTSTTTATAPLLPIKSLKIGSMGKSLIPKTKVGIDNFATVKTNTNIPVTKDDMGLIQEYGDLHRNTIGEILNSQEGQARLRNLGIDPSKVQGPKLSVSVGTDNSSYNFATNTINANTREELVTPFSPRMIYEHELAHFFQTEYAKTRPIRFYDEATGKSYSRPLPTQIDKDLTPLGYETKNWFDNLTLDDLTPENYNIAQSALYFRTPLEKYPHLTEIRSKLLDNNIIQNRYQPITAEHLSAIKPGTVRLKNFLNWDNSEVRKILLDNLNKLPAVSLPIAATSAVIDKENQ